MYLESRANWKDNEEPKICESTEEGWYVPI